MNKADIKEMDTTSLFNLQAALNAKYVANEVVDIKLLNKVDAELNIRFN